MTEFKFGQGDMVKDSISGFKGIVASRCDHFYGCNTYGVKQKKLKDDGTVQDAQWFDEPQLEMVKRKVPKAKKWENGGPITVPDDTRSRPH